MNIRVYHTSYGCDTGCCGHCVELDGDQIRERFEFTHDEDDWAEWAKGVVKERWPECYDSIDWASLDLSEINPDC
jgi:hypothetical protein